MVPIELVDGRVLVAGQEHVFTPAPPRRSGSRSAPPVDAALDDADARAAVTAQLGLR